MTPTPRIVIHESGDAPTGHRFVGGLYLGNKRLPIIFANDDRSQLIETMRAFIEEDGAKAAKRRASLAAHSARMRKGAVVQ